MALTAKRRIPSNHFTGQSNLQQADTDSLGAIVRGILIREARVLSAAVTYPGGSENITDNSGGLAGILFTAAVTDILTLVAVDGESFKTGDGPFQLATVGGALSGSPGVVISTTLDDWTRDAGSWITDGFKVGQTITVTGSASNNSDFVITAVAALILTTDGDDLTTEGSQTDLVITAPGILPTGLAAATDYYIRRITASTYKLSLTKAAAIDVNGAIVDITAQPAAGDHRILAIGQPTAIVTDDGFGDTDSFTAASGNTSFDDLMDAYAIFEDYIDAGLLAIGAGTLPPGPGTVAAAGTVAAIDVDVAANADDITGTTFKSALAIVTEIENSQKTLIDAIDVLRVALGLAEVPVARNVLGTVDVDGINGDDAITNCVTTDATTILESATEAGIEIWLQGMADNVAFLADMCDAIGDVAADANIANYAGA